jgi:catechol 2,3-dioxygenase-like lactoylglutathione lyase family enzyme
MDLRLEAIVLPVSDVDRAKAFYETVGFRTDVDLAGEGFRVVQLTPPGSGCSILIGRGMPQSEPGSFGGLHLVVDDLIEARAALIARGVDVGEPFHFSESGTGPSPGFDPERRNYMTYAPFEDPDGNGWLLQDVPNERNLTAG